MASSAASTRSAWTVGAWRLDAETGELRMAGSPNEAQRIEPKVAEVLVYLAGRAGQVVGREELLGAVWPGVVVGDDALTQAIIKLRKALGDDARRPQYIETLAKRGYRLIAPVESLAARAEGGSEPSASMPAAPPAAGADAASAAVMNPAAMASQQADAEAAALAAPAAPAARSANTRSDNPTHPAVRPAARKRWWIATLVGSSAVATLAAVVAFGIHRGWAWPIGSDTHTRAAAESLPVIAVLPLRNHSGDPKREFFADGVTDDIIHALGRYNGLRVISRHSVQQFKQREATPQVVRSELGARYVVTGSVQEAGTLLRVAVELSEAASARVLWSERFERQGQGLFEIQESIVRNIVGALAVRVTKLEIDRAASRPPSRREAYDLVLLARSLEARGERAANRQGRAYVAQARELAPEYAMAYVVESELEEQRASLGWIEDPVQGLLLAERAARHAITLDDPGANARAHARLARVHYIRGEHEQALAESERARSLNPSDNLIAEIRGEALLFAGRHNEAVELIESAIRLDPAGRRSPVRHTVIQAYFAAERYPEALAACERALAENPELPFLHAMRAIILAQTGRVEEARRAVAEVKRLQFNFPFSEFGARHADPAVTERIQAALRKAGG